MNNKGLTLIEVIIVIVIIGILSTITVLSIGSYIESTKLKSDINSVEVLNRVTAIYQLESNITSEDVFLGYDTDEERLTFLSDNKFLNQDVTPISTDSTISWNTDSQLWELEVNGVIYTNALGFDFSSMTLEQAENSGMFIEGGDANVRYNDTLGAIELESQKAKILNAINKDEYTATFTWSSDATNDPRIVFVFDYYGSSDLGEGTGKAILLRANSNFARLFTVTKGESYKTLQTFNYSSSLVIPTWKNDKTFYNDTHTTKLVVSRISDTQKKVQIYIDNTFLTEFTYNQATINEDIYYGVSSQKKMDGDVFVYSMNAN